MADLNELYGVTPDANPMQVAAAQRAAATAARMRAAQTHAPEAEPLTFLPQPPPPLADAQVAPGVLDQAHAAAAAEEAAAAEYRAAQGIDQAGPGQAAAGPGDALGQMRDAAQERALGVADVLDSPEGYKVSRSRRPMYEPVRQWVQSADEHNRGQLESADSIRMRQAKLERDRAELADDTHAASARMELRQSFLAEQQARKRADIEDNVAKYAAAADVAAKEFAEVERFTPGKAWADKSVGAKIGITLAAIGRGFRGGNPSDVFTETLQRELAAHKQTRADAGERLGVARASRDNATKRMQTFLALTQDERVADKMVEVTTLRGIAAKMQAMEEDGRADMGGEVWKAAREDIKMRLANTELQIRQREANNPKYTTRKVDAIGKNKRAVMGKIMNAEVGAMAEAGKQFAGMQRDAAKSGASVGRQEKKDRFEQKKWLASETEDIRTELKLIDEFEKKYADDIPGVHALSRVTPDSLMNQFQGNREAKKELERIVMLRLRRESGAAISEEELQREMSKAMSEDDVRADLRRRREESGARLDYLTRATGEELEGEYLARPVDQRSALRQGGGGGQAPSSLVMDE